MNKLKKDDEKILFYIYKKKYVTNYKPFRTSDLVSEFITEFNGENIIDIVFSFVSKGFIVVKMKGTKLEVNQVQDILKNGKSPDMVDRYGFELCAPNVEKITEIKKLLRYRRGINWLKENIILTWRFIWRHFIVTIMVAIIVAALTTYIITEYITPP